MASVKKFTEATYKEHLAFRILQFATAACFIGVMCAVFAGKPISVATVLAVHILGLVAFAIFELLSGNSREPNRIPFTWLVLQPLAVFSLPMLWFDPLVESRGVYWLASLPSLWGCIALLILWDTISDGRLFGTFKQWEEINNSITKDK